MKYNVGQTVMADHSFFEGHPPVLGIITNCDENRYMNESFEHREHCKCYKVEFADGDIDWFTEVDINFFMEALAEYQKDSYENVLPR